MSSSETNNTDAPEITETNLAPIPKKPNKWLKIVLLGILGLAIVGSLVYAGYWCGKENLKRETQSVKSQLETENLTPTKIPAVNSTPTSTLVPDGTADWKTYRNTKVGFQFKYPFRCKNPRIPSGPGYEIYADGTEDSAILLFDLADGYSGLNGISLTFFPYSGTLDNFKEEINKHETPGKNKSMLIRRSKVNRQYADWYIKMPLTVHPDEPGIGPHGRLEIYFKLNDYGFFFNLSRDHSEEEMVQILSTFKFLE
ncbi:hypothetical protein ISS85_02120 [Candidatus Microgenomates bacterium]|nr:hypothetical protein [Candidatus Microgenomates bacterium]